MKKGIEMRLEINYILVLLLVFVKMGFAQGWYTLGSAEISTGQVYYLSMALASDGTLYVGFADGANRSKSTAMCFDNSNWAAIGTVGFINWMPSNLNFTLSNGGYPFFALRYSEHPFKQT